MFDVYCLRVPSGRRILAVASLPYDSDPLVVTKFIGHQFPARVTYVHGETAARAGLFSQIHPLLEPGQPIRWMMLAGHGVLSNNARLALNARLRPRSSRIRSGPNNTSPGMLWRWIRFYGTNAFPPLLATFGHP